MSITLRPYQHEGVDIGVEYFKQPKKNTKPKLMVYPVAAGKSVIIASTAYALENPSIVLQPSKELLEQNYEKLISLGGEAEIFSASKNKKNIGHLTYATLGSIKNKADEFKKRGVKHVLVDEAHLYSSNLDGMFRKFMKELGVKSCIGYTATPIKLVQRGFALDRYSQLNMLTNGVPRFFSDILHVLPISEMIKNNYWKKLEYDVYDYTNDILKAKDNGSEFTDISLRKWYKETGIRGKILEKLKKLLNSGKQAITVFLDSVEECKKMASYVRNNWNETAVAVYGDMPDKTYFVNGEEVTSRTDAIEGFKSGKIKIAFSVGVLTTGFDYPRMDALILARPTMSLALYYQMVGRITRLFPNITGTIVDLAGLIAKFGRIEDLEIENIEGHGWGMFSQNRLLSDIPMDGRMGDITKKTLIARYNPPKIINNLSGLTKVNIQSVLNRLNNKIN